MTVHAKWFVSKSHAYAGGNSYDNNNDEKKNHPRILRHTIEFIIHTIEILINILGFEKTDGRVFFFFFFIISFISKYFIPTHVK